MSNIYLIWTQIAINDPAALDKITDLFQALPTKQFGTNTMSHKNGNISDSEELNNLNTIEVGIDDLKNNAHTNNRDINGRDNIKAMPFHSFSTHLKYCRSRSGIDPQ